MSPRPRAARTVHAPLDAVLARLGGEQRGGDGAGEADGDGGGGDGAGAGGTTVVVPAPDAPGSNAPGRTVVVTLWPTADGVELAAVLDPESVAESDPAGAPEVLRAGLIALLDAVAADLGDDDGDRAGRHLTVVRHVDASPAAVFGLLADPARHVDLDASGTVQAARTPGPLTAVGQVFTVAMHGADMGDYDVDNHVVALEPDRLITWAPASAGGDRGGQLWSYVLAADGSGTRVEHTYDWSGVTLERLLPYLPVVDAPDLAATLVRLTALLPRP